MPAAPVIAAGITAAASASAGSKGGPEAINSTKQTTFAAPGDQERKLQQQSIDAYLKQQQLTGQAEQGLSGADQYEQASQRAGLDILNGNAFNPTQSEQQRISDLRNQLLQESQGNINQFLQEGETGATRQAGLRGLRGQAASQIQGQVLKLGADQYGQALRSANTQAAQQYLQLPQQRIAAQQGLIGQGLSFADQLRNQAIQNQLLLQSPIALQTLMNERLAGGKTTTLETPYDNGGNAKLAEKTALDSAMPGPLDARRNTSIRPNSPIRPNTAVRQNNSVYDRLNRSE